ncbi:MAG: sterol desaturase family protein [Pseudomonadota bacterium]
MNREIRYLLLMVVALSMCIAGYYMNEHIGYPSLPAQARAGGAGTGSALGAAPAREWAGHSRLGPFLHVNLDSALRIERGADGAPVIAYAVGGDSSAGAALARASVLSSGGVSKVSWSGASNEYEFVLRDGADTGRLYVTRNRVRYLVLMAPRAAGADSASAAVRFGDGLSAVAQEGWQLLRPRFIGLLISYAFIAGVLYAAYWLLLKKRLAHRKIQTEAPKKGAVWFEVRHSFIAIIAIALFSYGLVFAVESGYTKIYRDVAQYGWAYWFFSLALLLVLVDAYVYWTHRLMHHRSLFKYFHKVHHHSTRPTPWATFSVNVNEVIVNAWFMPLVVLVLPVHQNTTIVFGLVSILKNVINHLGFTMFPAWASKGVLGWVVSPTYHETHHIKFNCNYSAYFTWWDRWMGTEQASFDAGLVQTQARGRRVAEMDKAA